MTSETRGQPPAVRLRDSLSFNTFHMLPLFLRGIIVPERCWTRFSARWLGDPVSVRFVHRLQRRYRSDRFFIRLFEFGANRLPRFKPLLLVTGAKDIEAVLADPDSYGSDATSKVERMSLVAPGAVIISGGEEAGTRRRFNESVLDTGSRVHRCAREFLGNAVSEAGELARLDRLHRPDFERLARRVALQTALGPGRVDGELSTMLDAMIHRASRLWWFRKSRAFQRFYDKLAEHLEDDATGGLLGRCRHADAQDVPVAAQAAFWLFVLKDALEIHVPRTLALIASHPDVEKRVRAELSSTDPAEPDQIDGLALLEGCVHEAIRLWAPVPLLLRRTTRPVVLNGAEIPAETTILIHAGQDCRDLGSRGDTANQFDPDQWVRGQPQPPMNHFSNGPRICAGKPLILLLVKATVATLLRHDRFVPDEPLDTHGRLPYLFDAFTASFRRSPLPAADPDPKFDFIVVGAGAAGGPLAANLARAGRHVLLLEAGGDASPNLATQVPVFHPETTEDPALSWRFFVRHYDDPDRDAADSKFFTGSDAIPDPQPGGGIFYPRASTVGGCTVHNAMITVCPHNSDWDYIAKATGDPGWSSTAMRRHFQRLERCRYGWGSLPGRVLRWCSGGWAGRSARHGYDGWLTVERSNPWLVFRDWKLLMLTLATVLQVFRDRRGGLAVRIGFLLRNLVWAFDPNHWRRLEKRPEGIALTPVATRNGRRDGPREYLNRTRVQHPDRLEVVTDALATRVLFDETDPARAIGVEYLSGARAYRAAADAANGELPRERAEVGPRGEVILCAGAFNTPQLLMLSGIGPQEELARHGIDPHPKIDLPGVGENLQDRYEISVVVEMHDRLRLLRDLHYRRTPDDRHYFDWQTARRRRGVYATNGVLVGVTRRSAPDRPDPDLYIFGGPGYFGGYEPGYSDRLTRSLAVDKNCFTWAILKGHGSNVSGRVRLSAADPRAAPEINFHYFDDFRPTSSWEDDLDAVLEGIRFVRRVNHHRLVKRYVKAERIPGEENDLPPPQAPPWHPDKLGHAVKRLAWGHHAAGTCRMGQPGDGSVVDSGFRVHGARNLRVVDASVFPRIPGLFIVSAVYMIAEKATDLLLNGESR